MSDQIKCQDCEKFAVMFEEDNTGWCYEHAIEHAQEEYKKEEDEEKTGISELDIINRAMEKLISIKQAKEELLKEKEASK